MVVGGVAAGQSRVNAEGKMNMGVFWSEERSDCTQLPVSQSQMRLERECAQRKRPVAVDGGGEESRAAVVERHARDCVGVAVYGLVERARVDGEEVDPVVDAPAGNQSSPWIVGETDGEVRQAADDPNERALE